MKWFKQIFGIKPEEEPSMPNDERFTGAVATNPLVVSPMSINTSEIKKHTKGTLNKYTKVELEDLARSEFGLELDRRKRKDVLITEIINSQ
jgi:hypothetical protein